MQKKLLKIYFSPLRVFLKVSCETCQISCVLYMSGGLGRAGGGIETWDKSVSVGVSNSPSCK